MIPRVGQSYLQAERRVSSQSPGPPGLAFSFFRSHFLEEQRPALFPTPSGVSCFLSLVLHSGNVSLHKAILVFDVSHTKKKSWAALVKQTADPTRAKKTVCPFLSSSCLPPSLHQMFTERPPCPCQALCQGLKKTQRQEPHTSTKGEDNSKANKWIWSLASSNCYGEI